MPWNAKTYGKYTLSDNEGLENVDEIATLLQAISQFYPSRPDWPIISIAALVGNICNEGGLNPWAWENDIVPTVQQFNNWQQQGTGSNHGYGLVGWTPPWNYINSNNASQLYQWGYGPNFLDSAGQANDGDAQIMYITDVAPTYWQYRSASYIINYYGWVLEDEGFSPEDIDDIANMTYADFIGGNYSVEVLTAAYMCKFEGPSAQYAHLDRRLQDARTAYEYLTGIHPPDPGFIINANTWKFYLY